MSPRVFSGPQLCRATGITYRQLDYWARTELLRPSVSEARGSGSLRRYSEDDLRIAMVIRRALDVGVSLQRIRTALPFVRDNEGCRWLVIGDRDVGVVIDEGTAIISMVRDFGGGVVLDMGIDAPFPSNLSVARPPSPATPADDMRADWGKEAGMH